MKKVFWLTTLITFALGFGAGWCLQSLPKTYTNSDLDISFKYPKTAALGKISHTPPPNEVYAINIGFSGQPYDGLCPEALRIYPQSQKDFEYDKSIHQGSDVELGPNTWYRGATHSLTDYVTFSMLRNGFGYGIDVYDPMCEGVTKDLLSTLTFSK